MEGISSGQPQDILSTGESRESGEKTSGHRGVKALLSRFFRGKEAFLPQERPSRAELAVYRPDASKFPNPKIAKNFFHPLDHLARSLIWADVIANTLSQQEQELIDRRVLRTATVLHDVGRGEFNLNKHAHGERGAKSIQDRDWLAEVLPEARTEELSQKQVEDIAFLVENHHHSVRTVAEMRPEMALMLRVLKTADILDLARGNFALGGPISFITNRTNAIDNVIPIIKHGLNKTTPEANSLRTLASRLATKTQQFILRNGADRFKACLDVAQGMALIKP